MEWLAAVVGIIAFIYGLVKWRGFRRIVGGIVLLAVLVGTGLYLKNEADEKHALSLVKPSDLELRQVEMQEQYGSKKVFLTVKNTSQHAVKSLEFQARLLDCPTPASRRDQCETIGDTKGSVYMNIPPGQVRQADSYLHFSGAPVVKGSVGWTFDITKIRAE